MSYILDALKKSEQDRKQGEVPGLNSFQGQPRPPRSTSRIVLYLLIGALLLNALVLGIWVISRDSESPPSSADMSDSSVSREEKEPAIETTGSPETSEPADAASPEPDNSAPAEGSDPARESIDARPAPAPDEDSETAVDIPIEQDIEEEVEDLSRLVKYDSLPPNVRSDLGDLSISAHYYANDPRSRMVSINGRIMRQGQSVKDNLVLEEITRKGVVLTFRKYRFSMKVFDR